MKGGILEVLLKFKDQIANYSFKQIVVERVFLIREIAVGEEKQQWRDSTFIGGLLSGRRPAYLF